ncbi:MAG: VWA domain-containing protein [Aquabacterium sp.]|uniref:nitric oxide reductase activation protein NorD n=1 Tax=Aquabacterium sp. TaxID=1872578 RepID=UPI0025BF7FB6|nr:VWA domain-containing protein [Aquabacterium sp.]MBI5927120.1 VWA domain-containing protein [Aquabacterium sp.]
MEEWVGQWWHRIVTRLADRQYPQAAVRLEDMNTQLGVIFRAMGGLPQWRLASASERLHGGSRTLMQKIAGGGQRFATPVLDAETLALPPVLALFDKLELNRDLYLWLAGQGAMRLQWLAGGELAERGWVEGNLQATRALLMHYPGWQSRYRRLLEAHLLQRPDVAGLKGRQAQAEQLVQQALRRSLVGQWALPAGAQDVGSDEVHPVTLWVDVSASQVRMLSPARQELNRESGGEEQAPKPKDGARRRARQTDATNDKHGLMMFFRAESLLSWTEFVRVNRQTDEDELDDASQVANDMDVLSLAPGGQTLASRVRFDLDLPSSAADDVVIAQGIKLPEWDHRKASLLPQHCSVQVLLPTVVEPWQVPASLRTTASRMRRRLESLRALPRWQAGYTSGERLDMDAWVRWQTECRGDDGTLAIMSEPRVFARPQRSERSLATLLLADLSLSTDAWASQDARVIDVIREALYVFGQAMEGLGDPFEMLGFSSVKRHNVRVHALKRFDESWSALTRDRVGAIKPGYYTRMGAAIRYATRELSIRPEKQRLLLLLTDGKPNDLDHYEGRFGLEDTRHAVQAAKSAGLHPFCITIDEEASDYLPYLFGQHGYALVHKPKELVSRLTQIVGQLSA